MESTTILKSFRHWQELIKDKKFQISLISGILLMILAFFANLTASYYVDSLATYPAGDLILDNIPTYNLNFLYTTGLYILLGIVILYPILFNPAIAPFTLKTFAAFIIIRSIFISLTHLGVPEGFLQLELNWQNQNQDSFFKLFHLNDLFFSGHTGMPFLGFLIFKDKLIKYFLLFGSFLMGATVLLMHVHYSIDVFSAFFITYSIYIVSDRIFNNLNLSFKKIVERVENQERALKKFIKEKSKKTIETLGKMKKH